MSYFPIFFKTMETNITQKNHKVLYYNVLMYLYLHNKIRNTQYICFSINIYM